MNIGGTEFPTLLMFTALALVAVLVIAWLAIRLLAQLHQGSLIKVGLAKGSASKGTPSEVKVLQSVAVGQRERVVLIRYDGDEILLGVTTGGISVLEKKPQNNNESQPDLTLQ